MEQAIKEMEDAGYDFNKKRVGNVEQYALTVQNVIDIYAHRKIPKYREIHQSPYVIFVVNLKGGVSKTVSTVTLAHALRVHQDLLRHDLRILVIDLDRRHQHHVPRSRTVLVPFLKPPRKRC